MRTVAVWMVVVVVVVVQYVSGSGGSGMGDGSDLEEGKRRGEGNKPCERGE